MRAKQKIVHGRGPSNINSKVALGYRLVRLLPFFRA